MPDGLRTSLWEECARQMTELENCLVTRKKVILAYKMFYGNENPNIRLMRKFGEIGIGTIHGQQHIGN